MAENDRMIADINAQINTLAVDVDQLTQAGSEKGEGGSEPVLKSSPLEADINRFTHSQPCRDSSNNDLNNDGEEEKKE